MKKFALMFMLGVAMASSGTVSATSLEDSEKPVYHIKVNQFKGKSLNFTADVSNVYGEDTPVDMLKTSSYLALILDSDGTVISPNTYKEGMSLNFKQLQTPSNDVVLTARIMDTSVVNQPRYRSWGSSVTTQTEQLEMALKEGENTIEVGKKVYVFDVKKVE